MNRQEKKLPDIAGVFMDQQAGKGNSRIKTLIYLYEGNKINIAVSMIFYFLKSSPVWIIPIVTANIINIAGDPASHSLNKLWINLGVIMAFLVQNIPTTILHTGFFSRAIRQVEAGLRSALVKKLQELSISYHKEMSSGRIQSKILRDVEAVEFLSRQVMVTVIPSIINTIIALILTLTKNVSVAVFFLATIPVAVILIQLFRKNIRKTNNDFRKKIEEMNSNVSEMVEMIPVTRAHGLEEVEVEKMERNLEKVKESGYQLDIVSALFGSSTWVSFQFFQVICLAFTVYLAYYRQITIGDVVLYQGFFNSILAQVNGLIGIYPTIAKGFESVGSISEILTEDDIEDNTGKEKLASVRGAFSFKNVGFKYGSSDEPVLEQFNLEVEQGECIAFVGESGAGKTTLLNLLIGFYKPSSGSILLDGKDLSGIDMRSYRKFLAMVPQNNILFSGTILDNITYGLARLDRKKLDEVIKMANIKEFTDKLPQGLNTLVGEHGGKLSGGQRQRIAIARALIRDPRIIIFDEATSALDNISELHVQRAMKNLIKGRTTFIVAHRLSTIRDADRIVVVKDGSCSESGTYEELMEQKGDFYKLKMLQG